jgi:hypothetical protein
MKLPIELQILEADIYNLKQLIVEVEQDFVRLYKKLKEEYDHVNQSFE